jgi:hypothetical protein
LRGLHAVACGMVAAAEGRFQASRSAASRFADPSTARVGDWRDGASGPEWRLDGLK